MFQLMPEEHLGSYLLRRHYFSGRILDPQFMRTITLQHSNRWMLFPANEYKFEAGLSPIIENNTLYNLFRPTSSLYLLNNNYLYRNAIDYSSSQAIFCTACFEEQLVEHGHYWFKREWLIYKTKYCIKHKCYLSPLKCNRCNTQFGIKLGLISVLRRECNTCRGALDFTNPEKVADIPAIVIWSSALLNDGLPFFSKKLIIFLLYEAYRVTAGDTRPDESILSDHIMSLCYVFGRFGEKDIPECDIVNRWHTSFKIFVFLHEPDEFAVMPFLIFWRAMIVAFGQYESFKIFLQESSVEKIFYSDVKTTYLDLK